MTMPLIADVDDDGAAGAAIAPLEVGTTAAIERNEDDGDDRAHGGEWTRGNQSCRRGGIGRTGRNERENGETDQRHNGSVVGVRSPARQEFT